MKVEFLLSSICGSVQYLDEFLLFCPVKIVRQPLFYYYRIYLVINCPIILSSTQRLENLLCTILHTNTCYHEITVNYFWSHIYFTTLEQERRICVYFLLNDEMRLILNCCCNPRLLLNVFCLMFYGEINGWRKKSQRARGSWLDFDEWLQCNQACSVPFQSFFMTIVVRSPQTPSNLH